MTDSTDTTAENAVTTENALPSDANLTIQDLSTALQIIQVVGSRGAIKAEEMAVVGALYTKLKTFLDLAGSKAQELKESGKAPDEESDKEPEETPPLGTHIKAEKTADDAKFIGDVEK